MRLVTVNIVALSFPTVNSIKRVIITGLITNIPVSIYFPALDPTP